MKKLFNTLSALSSRPRSVFSHIRIWKGDVTDLSIDAITCGTNPDMKSENSPLMDYVVNKARPELKEL